MINIRGQTKKKNISTYDVVLCIIALLGEVQVMGNVVGFIGSKLDGHVKFTPSFFGDTERRVLESYNKSSPLSISILKCRE